MPQLSVSQGQPPPPSPPPAAPVMAQQWMPPLWWPPVYPGPLPVAGGAFPSGGTTSSGGMMPLTMTPAPVQPTANAAGTITGFSGCANTGQR